MFTVVIEHKPLDGTRSYATSTVVDDAAGAKAVLDKTADDPSVTSRKVYDSDTGEEVDTAKTGTKTVASSAKSS